MNRDTFEKLNTLLKGSYDNMIAANEGRLHPDPLEPHCAFYRGICETLGTLGVETYTEIATGRIQVDPKCVDKG